MKTRIFIIYTIGSFFIAGNLVLYYLIGYEMLEYLLYETAETLPFRLIPIFLSFIPMSLGLLTIMYGRRLQKRSAEGDANTLIDSLPGK